jgi:hypothetical protein
LTLEILLSEFSQSFISTSNPLQTTLEIPKQQLTLNPTASTPLQTAKVTHFTPELLCCHAPDATYFLNGESLAPSFQTKKQFKYCHWFKPPQSEEEYLIADENVYNFKTFKQVQCLSDLWIKTGFYDPRKPVRYKLQNVDCYQLTPDRVMLFHHLLCQVSVIQWCPESKVFSSYIHKH